jgi:hypothetical protein
MFNTKRTIALAGAIGLALSLSACMTPHSYVDQSLGEPHYADLKKSASPQPIQLLVEFQTKGVTNARATDAVKHRVYVDSKKSVDNISHSIFIAEYA